ncbi:MAG: DUF1697 domain-containing protein [Patescibacteria group bacterium]|nr:DUF1697 domain-containing protein [Patescibacteria group bacterium]
MRYITLLRGIGPTNPNMKSARLKAVFEGLGFRNVRTVIASGNVIFESPARDILRLERRIEKALPEKLGFNSTAIIRTEREFRALAKRDPFRGIRDQKPNYLLVTFFKDHRPEICSVIKLIEGKTPDFMRKLEQSHGKQLTSRTWKTVCRIVRKVDEING